MTLEEAFKVAIPVKEAHFHSAINNAQKVPENYFSMESNVPSRQIEMRISGELQLLIYRHKNELMWTPLANCKFGAFTKPNTEETNSDSVAKRGRPFKESISKVG